MERRISTKCVHGNEAVFDEVHYGAINYPIYQTATFAHRGLGDSTGYDYSRLQNPTRERLEKIIASLENGEDALAFSSGMAAITAVMELFSKGDHIIIDSDLYGGSIRLFHTVCENKGISFTSIDCSKEDVEAYIKEETKAIYIETPTNPMMHVSDIAKISKVAKARGILLIVDNTFLSPYFQNPIAFGADLVIHSGTKYLGGHNDTLAGFVVAAEREIGEKLRFYSKTTGANLSPFDSFLLIRGIKTLAVRLEQAQKNTVQIVEWFQKQKEVTKVYYPGIKSHPGYEIMKRQSRGFGAMVTFEVESKEFATGILEKTRLIQFAESLGGVETLITYPITQTHADVPKEELARNGITECVLRLSVGIEDGTDLINELQRVFQEVKEELYVRKKSIV